MTLPAPRLPYARIGRRNRDPASSADLHSGHALVPAGDDLTLAEAELERVAAVPGRVDLRSCPPRDTHVVDLHDTTCDGLLAAADDDVFKFELVGRRLARRDLDRRLLVGGHDGTVAMREPPRALSVGNPASRRFGELRESRCRALRTRAAWPTMPLGTRFWRTPVAARHIEIRSLHGYF